MALKLNLNWKKIGYVAAFFPFFAISGVFLYVLYDSNRVFFEMLLSSEIKISSKALSISSDVFFYVFAASVVILSIISIAKRKEKRLNLVVLIASIAVCIASSITFMIFCHLAGLYQIAFENVNLYLAYLLFALLANALPLFSSVRNLVKIKRAPVTFAKSEENHRETNG